MAYGILRTTINLRGRSFMKGSVVRIWELHRVTTIQPINGDQNLWYSLPSMHLRHITELNVQENDLVDLGIL